MKPSSLLSSSSATTAASLLSSFSNSESKDDATTTTATAATKINDSAASSIPSTLILTPLLNFEENKKIIGDNANTESKQQQQQQRSVLTLIGYPQQLLRQQQHNKNASNSSRYRRLFGGTEEEEEDNTRLVLGRNKTTLIEDSNLSRHVCTVACTYNNEENGVQFCLEPMKSGQVHLNQTLFERRKIWSKKILKSGDIISLVKNNQYRYRVDIINGDETRRRKKNNDDSDVAKASSSSSTTTASKLKTEYCSDEETRMLKCLSPLPHNLPTTTEISNDEMETELSDTVLYSDNRPKRKINEMSDENCSSSSSSSSSTNIKTELPASYSLENAFPEMSYVLKKGKRDKQKEKDEAQKKESQSMARKDILDELSCSICMEILIKTHVADPCGHVFCGQCIKKLPSQNRACPSCRIEMTSCTLVRTYDNVIWNMILMGNVFTGNDKEVHDDLQQYLKRSGRDINGLSSVELDCIFGRDFRMNLQEQKRIKEIAHHVDFVNDEDDDCCIVTQPKQQQQSNLNAAAHLDLTTNDMMMEVDPIHSVSHQPEEGSSFDPICL